MAFRLRFRTKSASVRADALEWKPDKPVDFLYADIWRCLEEPQTLDDVLRMQANVRTESINFWGQELAIQTLAVNRPEACASSSRQIDSNLSGAAT